MTEDNSRKWRFSGNLEIKYSVKLKHYAACHIFIIVRTDKLPIQFFFIPYHLHYRYHKIALYAGSSNVKNREWLHQSTVDTILNS